MIVADKMLVDTLSWDMVDRLVNVTTSKVKGFNISKEKSRSFENDFFHYFENRPFKNWP